MYLFTFLFKMTIVHRIEKIHQNVDDLSRLFTKTKTETNNLSNVVVANDEDLLKKIADELSNDKTFEKVIKKLKNQIKKTKNDDEKFKTKYQSYRMNSNTNFLYFKNRFYFKRFCISKKSQKKLLQYAHDEHAHEKIHKTYNLLYKSIFMSKMKRLMIHYVTFCFVCQLSKSSKQFSYEKFQFIEISLKFLTKLSLNFIVALSMISNNNNAIMFVIDHFIKYVKTISSKKTMSIEK